MPLPSPTSSRITEKQLKYIEGLCLDVFSGPEFLKVSKKWISEVLKKEIKYFDEIRKDEASVVINALLELKTNQKEAMGYPYEPAGPDEGDELSLY